MKVPSEFQINQLLHVAAGYDPVKAREYYLRTRKLKGRKPAQAKESPVRKSGSTDPRLGKTRAQIATDAKSKQRKELAQAIAMLEQKLQKLEALIKKREHAEAADNRKAKAEKERAAKERDKPKTAAEKAKIARENKKYRDKNQQKLKRDRDSNSGSSSKTETTGSESKHSISQLKTLATRVRGQIMIAKQKLAAL